MDPEIQMKISKRFRLWEHVKKMVWLNIRSTQHPQYSKSAVLKNRSTQKSARSRSLRLFRRLLPLLQMFYKLFETLFRQFRWLSFSRTKNHFHNNYILRDIQLFNFSLMRIRIKLLSQIFYGNFEVLFRKYRKLSSCFISKLFSHQSYFSFFLGFQIGQ